MTRYHQYIGYVLRHKWYVMLECFKIGLIWQGITHDWHKFLPSEFFAYANYFYGKNSKQGIKRGRDKTGYYKPTETGDSNFEMAWFRHMKKGRHHWQYWVVPVLPEDKILVIPDKYVKEMICDWVGAGMAQGQFNRDKTEWFEINKKKMKLNPETVKKIYNQLKGYRQ